MRGRCPRCGQGKLFASYLGFHKACANCGLDFGQEDVGDGAAFFVMSIVSVAAVLAILVLRFAFGAPIWLVMLGTVLTILVFGGWLLRPAKGLLFALQYKNKAREGRLK